MKNHASEGRAVAARAQVMTDGFSDHLLFRITVFTISAAGGYFFSRWVFTFLPTLPFWTNLAHEKANPAADALRTLHSGFTN